MNLLKTEAEKVVTICCLCQRVNSPHGWAHYPVSPGVRPTHGYCPVCYQKTKQDLQRSSRQGNASND